MPKQINDTHIVLICKVEHPYSVALFRPIGFCNVVYKVVTTATVQHPKLVLSKLILPTQGAFVFGMMNL